MFQFESRPLQEDLNSLQHEAARTPLQSYPSYPLEGLPFTKKDSSKTKRYLFVRKYQPHKRTRRLIRMPKHKIKTQETKIDKVKNVRTLIKRIKAREIGLLEYQDLLIQIGFRGGRDSDGYDSKQRRYWERRKKGLCVKCGRQVTKKNRQTGKLYRLCDQHRKEVDHKK